MVGPGCSDITITVKDVEYPAIPDHGIGAVTGDVVIEMPDSMDVISHVPSGDCVITLPGDHGGVGAFVEENRHTEGYPVSYTSVAACNFTCREEHADGQLMYRSLGFMYYIQNAAYSNVTEIQRQDGDNGAYMTYFERDVVYTGYVGAGDMEIDNGTRGTIKLTGKTVVVQLHQIVLVENYTPQNVPDDTAHNAPR